MRERPIDLRSDTVTRPTDAMRRAMADADVGDDVFGDDPTVIALEERAADLLGKDAGLFVASGTMGNLVSMMAHLSRGQEVIAGREHHLVIDEAAGHAVIVGVSARTLSGVDIRRLGSVPGKRAARSERCVRNPGLALRAATLSAIWPRITCSAASGRAGCSWLCCRRRSAR